MTAWGNPDCAATRANAQRTWPLSVRGRFKKGEKENQKATGRWHPNRFESSCDFLATVRCRSEGGKYDRAVGRYSAPEVPPAPVNNWLGSVRLAAGRSPVAGPNSATLLGRPCPGSQPFGPATSGQPS